jgi:hypothetical protein
MALSDNPICAIPHHLGDKYLYCCQYCTLSSCPAVPGSQLIRIDAPGRQEIRSDDEMWRQPSNIEATPGLALRVESDNKRGFPAFCGPDTHWHKTDTKERIQRIPLRHGELIEPIAPAATV